LAASAAKSVFNAEKNFAWRRKRQKKAGVAKKEDVA